MNNQIFSLAERVIKATQNSLVLSYMALSPAIYRMPVEFRSNTGVFGSDARKFYADPVRVCLMFRQDPNVVSRAYLHMLFHCIYLHQFTQKPKDADNDTWSLALDICAESAVSRLDRLPQLEGDRERRDIISRVAQETKLFLPEPVYNVLVNGGYEVSDLTPLFHLDDHVWLSDEQNGNNGSNSDDDNNNNQSQNNQPQNNDQNGDQNGQNDQNDQDDNRNDQSSGQNNDQSDDQNSQGNGDQNGQSSNGGQSSSGRDSGSTGGSGGKGRSDDAGKKQEWSDVARQIAADLQSFHRQQGSGAGNFMDEVNYLTQDRMDYSEFLRKFAAVEEVMKIDPDEFDINLYATSLYRDDGLLFIEPLEYKEDKAVREFVIAIDTSGSCSGDLVKKFLNKTYSILKSTESFSSRVNIHIVQCDERIQHDTKISNMEEMEDFLTNMNLYGFGGTDFRPVFEYVDELISKGEFFNLGGLIYFTDGYGVYPTVPTQYKTAFVFLEDYQFRNVPEWAMTINWKEED